jgi:hypothetical protein
MADIASMMGALIPTALLAFFFEWTLRRPIAATVPRVVTANVVSLAITTVIAGFGLADGGPPVFDRAFLQYLLPQAVWLVVMLILTRRRKAA